jgi:hypothetical protein
MVSKAAISRDWHVSRPYVSRCVNHRGCPRGSLQEARDWRDLNARKRPPTNPKSIARATEGGRLDIVLQSAKAKAIIVVRLVRRLDLSS